MPVVSLKFTAWWSTASHHRRIIHVGDGDDHRDGVAVRSNWRSDTPGMPAGSVARTTTVYSTNAFMSHLLGAVHPDPTSLVSIWPVAPSMSKFAEAPVWVVPPSSHSV